MFFIVFKDINVVNYYYTVKENLLYKDFIQEVNSNRNRNY